MSKNQKDHESLVECDHCGEMRADCREYAAMGEVICAECWAYALEHRGGLSSCEECGADCFEDDLEYVVTLPASSAMCRIEDAHPEEGMEVCPKCFKKYDPERLEALRELADEARAEYMREMRED